MKPIENIVGLHIGEESAAAVQCRRRRDGSVYIKRAGHETFSRDASDTHIAKALQRLWRRVGFRTYAVAACVDSRSLLLKFFSYPSMEPDELAAALKLEAEETLQQDPRDLFLDWHLGPSSGPNMEGFMVASPRTEVERVLALIRKARLFPVILDTGCTALANTFLAVEETIPSEHPVCILHIAGQTVDQSILLNDHRLFPYRIFSRAAGWEEGSEYLIQSMDDNFKHFQFKLRQNPVNRIIVTGFIPQQPSFLERLRNHFNMPVHAWNPCEHFQIRSKKLNARLKDPEGPGSLMALSLGMALR